MFIFLYTVFICKIPETIETFPEKKIPKQSLTTEIRENKTNAFKTVIEYR